MWSDPMCTDVDVLIVGASLAGVRTAESLRQEGFEGSILLIGDEPELPYDRPPLSKQFLAGEWDHDRIRLITAERAAELGIDLGLGVVATGLDPVAHQVRLADGSSIRYGTVVLATGASARPGPWTDSKYTRTLRSLADSVALRGNLEPGRRVVVIGAGYIGAEVAATAHARGCAVTVVDVAPNPYSRSLGDNLGEFVCGIHARHGVQSYLGAGVAGVSDGDAGAAVELSDGTVLEADAVVVGIGAAPNTGWLGDSGLDVIDGVACDEFGRALGVADVFAVGDVARWGGRRAEHWTSATEQARAIGHSIAQPDAPVGSDDVGYVWSHQYDWRIQLVGQTGPEFDCKVIGDVGGELPRVAGVYRDDTGRFVGIAAVNWPKAFVTGRRALGLEPDEQEQLLASLLP
jgi:phthalate 3,4-dioxygenase ferredoxin reductase subunit